MASTKSSNSRSRAMGAVCRDHAPAPDRPGRAEKCCISGLIPVSVGESKFPKEGCIPMTRSSVRRLMLAFAVTTLAAVPATAAANGGDDDHGGFASYFFATHDVVAGIGTLPLSPGG